MSRGATTAIRGAVPFVGVVDGSKLAQLRGSEEQSCNRNYSPMVFLPCAGREPVNVTLPFQGLFAGESTLPTTAGLLFKEPRSRDPRINRGQ
jgi:hypothetical protein